jgi:hypothetical protein
MLGAAGDSHAKGCSITAGHIYALQGIIFIYSVEIVSVFIELKTTHSIISIATSESQT